MNDFDTLIYLQDIIFFNALGALSLTIVYFLSREVFPIHLKTNIQFYSLLSLGWMPNVLYLTLKLVEGRTGLEIPMSRDASFAAAHTLNVFSSGVFLLAARTQFSKSARRLMRTSWIFILTLTLIVIQVVLFYLNGGRYLASVDWLSVSYSIASLLAVSYAFHIVMRHGGIPFNRLAKYTIIMPLVCHAVLQLTYFVPQISLTPQHDLSSVLFLLGGILKYIHFFGVLYFMRLYVAMFQSTNEQSHSVILYARELEHELTTPLIALSVLANNLQLASISLATSKNISKSIETTVQGVFSRVDSFNVFMRVAGKTVGSDAVRTCNLNAIIQSAIINVRMHLKCKQKFNENYTAATCFLAHETQIHQIFENLVINAIEATGAHFEYPILISTCIVSHGKTQKSVQATISNLFLKPNSLDLESVFDRGYSTKGKNRVGLGLYLALKCAQDNGGTIKASVKESNDILTFIVTVSFPFHPCIVL